MITISFDQNSFVTCTFEFVISRSKNARRLVFLDHRPNIFSCSAHRFSGSSGDCDCLRGGIERWNSSRRKTSPFLLVISFDKYSTISPTIIEMSSVARDHIIQTRLRFSARSNGASNLSEETMRGPSIKNLVNLFAV